MTRDDGDSGDLSQVKRDESLESLITPVTWHPACLPFTLKGMFSANWLQQHEVLAAVVFVTLSIALTGFFAWLEHRFFRQ